MFTFKNFLLEKIVGNTGWVYHRTKNNPEDSDIVKYGIKPSTNQSAMYGRGLYCCYDLDQQLKLSMRKYGAYILKGKIDLNGFAILDEDIFRLANPRGDFESHLKQIGTSLMEAKDRSILPYTSRIAQRIWKKCKANGYNGIIFTGETDGKVAVIWNRRNFIPYQYTKDDGKSWEKLNPDISSIKRKEDSEYDKDDEVIKFSKILKELSNKEELGNIKFPSEYKGIISFKKLKKIGHFDAIYVKELNLPQLQISGDIYAGSVKELNLPQLQKSGRISAYSATEINLPQLQSGDIYVDNITKLNLPQLQKSGGISADNVTELNLPQLQTIEDIYVNNVKELNLPQLQTSGEIHASKATKLNLPQLQTSWYIYASEATEINLPQLQKSGDIYADKAKKINIPRHLKNNLRRVPPDCEIIHPEDTPQIKVDENVTFKKYLMLKEKSNLLNEWTRELMPEIYISNKERFDMWDKFENKEISENDFLKAIDFERTKPNTSIDIDSQSDRSENFFCVNEWLSQKELIHQKMWWDNGEMREEWRNYDSDGNLTRHWDNQGNDTIRDSKINEKGQLTKTKIRKINGKMHLKQIEVFEKKNPNNPLKSPDLIYYYYEGENGVKEEIKYEYKYDENQREVYKKENSILDNKVIETVREYWDDGAQKNIRRYENGKLTKEVSFTKKGDRKIPESLSKIAEKRAEEYNRKYHGIFLHSASKHDIKNLIKIKEDGNKAEICVSTLRSNTVFQSGADRVVIVGFGNIRELYNYDSYSERDEDGSRYATQTSDDANETNLHNIRKDNIEGYDAKYHYDEGFMDFSNAEVVAVFADYDKVINNWVIVDDGGNMYSDTIIYKRELPKIYKEYKSYVSDRVDKLKVTSFKTFIKKLNPNIKVIELSKFNELQNSEELMKLMYRLKDESESSELMDEPLHPYEEKTNFKTFKKFITESKEDYKGEHTAPDPESGAPAYDLTMNGVYPKDVYNMPSWYESEEGLDEMYKIIRLKGKPDGPVWIHRAIPMEVYKRSEGMRLINTGDWVTTSKQYAKDHGESLFKGDYKIISKRVRASEIFTNGDSIMEWGYYPN